MIMLWVFHYQITLQLQDNDISGKAARLPCRPIRLFCWAQSLHIDSVGTVGCTSSSCNIQYLGIKN